MVRVRFAPSPTGYLHIGSARTALFNWLFAKRHSGRFLLRIEDTDKSRSDESYLKEILESLEWLGMKSDEEPYFQSNRLSLYNKNAEDLIKAGKAYREDGAIIFKIPETTIVTEDIIHGRVEFDSHIIKDQVLIKSDGLPTYNFACVVDDADMKITHIIRGDDHLSNTPKQLLLYDALRLEPPLFAHIPLILETDRSRLSKRTGATALREFREEGYLPQAVINFLALLGWSPKDNREIISTDELLRLFDIKDVKKTGAIFNQEKLDWLNGQYIKRENPQRLTDLLLPELKKQRYLNETISRNWLESLVKLYQPRIKTLKEFVQQTEFFFKERIEYDTEAVKKFLKGKELLDALSELKRRFELLSSFEPKLVEETMRALAKELNIVDGALIHPVRVALTGKTVSPGLFDIISLLGKEKTVDRIEYAMKELVIL